MDEILSNKPNDKLENVDSHVKTYIDFLERKLKSFFLWENFNDQFKIKYLDLQEELFALKTQKLENDQLDEQQKQQIQQLQEKNIILDNENKQLKLQITEMQLENEQFKNNSSNNNNNNNNNKISTIGSSTSNKPSLESCNVTDNNTAANCVLIKGFTELQLQAIPKKNVINLARNMNIKISDKDIVSVSTKESKFYNRNNLKPNKILLIVQFRSAELKVEFLRNKEKLKQQSNLSHIEIADYVTDEVFDLYQYAKILKSHGYNIIYWRNNCVYVKKTQSSFCEPILIKSTKDVDNLKFVKKK